MDATNREEQARLELAVDAALEAGRHTLRYFRQDDLVVDRKTDDSPVTIADKEAEQLLRRRIEERFPDDAILGEEFDDVAGKIRVFAGFSTQSTEPSPSSTECRCTRRLSR